MSNGTCSKTPPVIPSPITCVTALALECRVVWTTPHASEREPYIYCFSVQMNQVIHGYPFLVVQNYPIISMLFGTMVHLNLFHLMTKNAVIFLKKFI